MAGGRIYINLYDPASRGLTTNCVEQPDYGSGDPATLALPAAPCS
jgi:hypothetical protein